MRYLVIKRKLCYTNFIMEKGYIIPYKKYSQNSCGLLDKNESAFIIARHSTLDTRHSTLDTRHSTLDTRHSTLDTRHSTLDTRHSTLDTRHVSSNKNTTLSHYHAQTGIIPACAFFISYSGYAAVKTARLKRIRKVL